MKLARFLWISASVYFPVISVVYIFVLDSSAEGADKLKYMLDNYLIYSHQFKAEFLTGAFLCISSFAFAIRLKRMVFVLIGTGQLIYALAFPLIISVYPYAETTFSLAMGRAANSMVTFGLMLSLAGFFMLHLRLHIIPKWMRLLALLLSVAGFISYLAAFIGFITDKQAQLVMFLVTFLYPINAYLALKFTASK